MPDRNAARPAAHTSSTGWVDTVNSREPHGGDPYIDTTAGRATGRSGLLEPSGEDAYWSKRFAQEAYVQPESKFEDYSPAYRFGALSFSKHRMRTFEEVEAELGEEWDLARAGSSLKWAHAKEAVKAAWRRLAEIRSK